MRCGDVMRAGGSSHSLLCLLSYPASRGVELQCLMMQDDGKQVPRVSRLCGLRCSFRFSILHNRKQLSMVSVNFVNSYYLSFILRSNSEHM